VEIDSDSDEAQDFSTFGLNWSHPKAFPGLRSDNALKISIESNEIELSRVEGGGRSSVLGRS